MGVEKGDNRLTRWFTYLFSEGENLKGILQRILNSRYRAEHREEDYRTWYEVLVRCFEAFLKKLYAVCHGVPMPKRENGFDPTFLDNIIV